MSITATTPEFFIERMRLDAESIPWDKRASYLEHNRALCLAQFSIPAVRMTAVQVDPTDAERAEWKHGATHYRCHFTCNGKRMSVPYHMGLAHKNPPTMWKVLSCLFSDADSAGESFESWASDMGMDTDSRKAEKTYKACQSIAKRLDALFGSNLEVWRELSRDV